MTASASDPCPTASTDPWRMPCAVCALGPLCEPRQAGVDMPGVRLSRRHVRRGDVLLHRTQSFHALYAPRTGVFKTFVTDAAGRAQVLDFQMPGDLIGLDGLTDGTHQCDVVALADAEVCVVAFDDACATATNAQRVGRELQRRMAAQVQRQQQHAVLLRSGASSQRRVARFLVDWTARLSQLGMPTRHLLLRMTREDVGSLLGMSIETVSRILSQMARLRVLGVWNRYIEVLNASALHELAYEHRSDPVGAAAS